MVHEKGHMQGDTSTTREVPRITRPSSRPTDYCNVYYSSNIRACAIVTPVLWLSGLLSMCKRAHMTRRTNTTRDVMERRLLRCRSPKYLLWRHQQDRRHWHSEYWDQQAVAPHKTKGVEMEIAGDCRIPQIPGLFLSCGEGSQSCPSPKLLQSHTPLQTQSLSEDTGSILENMLRF